MHFFDWIMIYDMIDSTVYTVMYMQYCIRHRAFGADGVLRLSSWRVIYLLYLPSSLSNFSLRDLKSAPGRVTPCPLDTSWTSKMAARRLQDASCLPSFFGCFFASIFNWFLMPTWLQLASENRWKSMKIDAKSNPHLAFIFYRLLVDLCSLFRSLKPHFL